VIAHDVEAFQSIYPNVTNVIGNFDFALPASGGAVRLLDHRDSILRELNYGDSLPWPMVADGGGRTMEFADGATEQDNPSNWFAGCMLGSPGEGFTPCNSPIVFSEINYASAPASNAGDWIELRNVSDETYDISNWLLRDDQDQSEYMIPQNTILDPGEMIVLCRNTEQFDGIHATIENRVGNFSFGFGENGELIRLYDDQGKINFSVYYQSQSPWPTEANAQGYTLELADSSANMNVGENWFAGCQLGSPGNFYTPCGPDAVEAYDKALMLRIFPNPTQHTLHIQLPIGLDNTAVISITDLQGKLMHQQQLSSTAVIQMNVQSWNNGMYILTIRDDEHTWHQRWIKE
jgi:hypothetical protein